MNTDKRKVTIGQKAMWASYQPGADQGAYNINYIWDVSQLDIQIFTQTLLYLQTLYPTWLHRYRYEDGDVYLAQVENLDLPILVIDLDQINLSLDEKLAELEVRPFKIETEPAPRWYLFTRSNQCTTLFFQTHHVTSDGWTIMKTIDDLKTVYNQILDNDTPYLPTPIDNFEKFVTNQDSYINSVHFQNSLRFWHDHLKGSLPVLQLQTDLPRPPVLTYSRGVSKFSISRVQQDRVENFLHKNETRLYSLMFSIFALMLHRYSGQPDIIIATPTAGRGKEYSDLLGYFVNTVVIRSVFENISFSDFLNTTNRCIQECFQHRDAPFSIIAHQLEYERLANTTPIFQTQFVFEDNNRFLHKSNPIISLGEGDCETWDMGAMRWQRRLVRATLDPFDLTLRIVKAQNSFYGIIEYRNDLFFSTTMERFGNNFSTLLESAIAFPHQRADLLSMVSPSERQICLDYWNRTDYEYPICKNLLDLFEARVAQNPHAPALVFNSDTMAYKVLSDKSNMLGQKLRTLGAREGEIVGICLERSFEMLVGLYGILKAGAAYTPIDPELPKERIHYLIKDSGITLLICQPHTVPEKCEHTVTPVILDPDWQSLAGLPTLKPDLHCEALEMAYMIYTSGSTGNPKGAINSHEAICNRLQWMQHAYPLDENDTVLQKTPYSFDVSVWEFFWPLQIGARLAIAAPGGHKDPSYISHAITRHGVTTLHFVPSVLVAFLDDPSAGSCACIKQVFCSGEALSLSSVKRFLQLFPNTKLFNLYGPTEAAVDVTAWTCNAAALTVPIGTPISNTKIYILDKAINPQPIGVPGELHIAGIALARGYNCRPALTAEKFIPDPYSGKPGQRMYKSGDNVYYSSDSNIQYLGRLDFQVKIRGLRIELGEINARIGNHPAVKESIVLVRDVDQEAKRLIAYVINEPMKNTTSDELYNYLREFLPEYMIPTSFIFMDSFPITANGKIDRKALPSPVAPRIQHTFTAPTNEIEYALAQIWCKALDKKQVGIHDNFFELGGDSILSFKIISAAAKQNIHLSPSHILMNQTIAKLAAYASGQSDIQAWQKQVTGAIPLTPVQRWFFDHFPNGNPHWNMAVSFEIRESLDLTVLERALTQLRNHHDMFRARFNKRDHLWTQSIATDEQNPVLKVYDPQRYAAGLQQALQELQASLDLTNGPILRALLVRELGKLDRLVCVVHHLAMDGVSWRIFEEDLSVLLEQSQHGQTNALPLKTTSFQDWSIALGKYALTDVNRQKCYWEGIITRPNISLPLTSNGENDYASERIVSRCLTAEQTRVLIHEVPRQLNATVVDVLLAAFAETLSEWLGDGCVQVDMEGHGREDVFNGMNVSRTIGWFTSIFPTALNLNRTELNDRINYLKRMRQERPQNGIGYGLLRYLTGTLGEPTTNDILFNYLGQFNPSENSVLRMVHDDCGPCRAQNSRRTHIFEVNALVSGKQFRVDWHYSLNLHTSDLLEQLVDTFLAQLITLLEQVNPTALINFPNMDFTTEELANIPALMDSKSVTAKDIHDIYPLTPAQQGILLYSLLRPDDGTYIVQTIWKIAGPLDRARFSASWHHAINAYSALRTSFHFKMRERPFQVVHRDAMLTIEYLDWSDHQDKSALTTLCQEEQSRGFSLHTAPLLRLVLVRHSADDYTLIWTNHHLILDGWSWPLVLKTVFAAYRQKREALQVELAPFSNHVARINVLPRNHGEDFWRIYLAHCCEPLHLGFSPSPMPLPGRVGSLTHQLDAALFTRLKELAKSYHLTMNTLVQSAWSLLLSHYSGGDDILFGVTVSGRPPELEHAETMVGMFINTLPFRIRLQANQSFVQMAHAVQECMFSLAPYESCSLVDIQGWSEIPRERQLFDSIFVYENYPIDQDDSLDGSDLTLQLLQVNEKTNYLMSLVVFPEVNKLKIALTFDLSYATPSMITQMLHHLGNLLHAIAAAEHTPVFGLAFLSPEEAKAQISGFAMTTLPNAADAAPSSFLRTFLARSGSELNGLEESDRAFVIRDQGRLVPLGLPGELALPESTVRKLFGEIELEVTRLTTPHWKQGERLYRTGDLVRVGENGRIEYIGTIDSYFRQTTVPAEEATLTAPTPITVIQERYVIKPASSEVESILLGYWQEILNQEAIGVDQDFFRLGGHSLMVTRLQSRIRNGLGIEIELPHFFSQRTIEQMAKLIVVMRGNDQRNDNDAEFGEI